MADLVSLEQLKRELKLPSTSEENDVLQRKLDEAHALCLDYVNQRIGDEVAEAILEMAVILYRFRGDDVDTPKWMEEGCLPPGVRMKLGRHRDPVIA
jgi:hypothetical protein